MMLKTYINNRVSQLNDSNFNLYEIKLSNINNEEYHQHYNYLNKEEKQKAKEFLSNKLASEFALCRSICKQLIANHLNSSIEEIEFKYTEKEKPYLTGNPIFFNISHSKDYALIAIHNQNIGVDIEFMDKNIEIKELMKIFCFYHEIEWALAKDSVRRFYNIWTVKEAILKHMGEGITVKEFPHLVINNERLKYPEYKITQGILYKDYSYAVCLQAI
jgi:4'-phosphopantetheinyl transferase